FHGPNLRGWRVPDLSSRELAVLFIMLATLLWLGLAPQPVLDTARPSLRQLQPVAPRATVAP
ncbi:MAG TPA: hypothetical protein VMG58_13325, partial [Candidatus Sulfotelmatobacter sp.]|nr:hypothetical protein [Candidatus Sulfotelmatobacter sp.]